MATKLAFDVDFLDLAEGIIITLMGFTPFDDYEFKTVRYCYAMGIDSTPQNCRVWSILLKRFLKDSDNSFPGKELIFKIQEYAEEHHSALKIFPDVIKGLLESTIIEKAAITEWAEELEEEDDPTCKCTICSCNLLMI